MIKAIYNGFEDNTLTILHTSDNLQEGTEYCLELVEPSRSQEHLNLFWLWVTVLAEHHGYSKRAMKMELFEHFGFGEYHTNKVTGIVKFIDDSVGNNIARKKLNEYMKEIDLFAKEHGIDLPNPENLIFENIKVP